MGGCRRRAGGVPGHRFPLPLCSGFALPLSPPGGSGDGRGPALHRSKKAPNKHCWALTHGPEPPRSSQGSRSRFPPKKNLLLLHFPRAVPAPSRGQRGLCRVRAPWHRVHPRGKSARSFQHGKARMSRSSAPLHPSKPRFSTPPAFPLPLPASPLPSRPAAGLGNSVGMEGAAQGAAAGREGRTRPGLRHQPR